MLNVLVIICVLGLSIGQFAKVADNLYLFDILMGLVVLYGLPYCIAVKRTMKIPFSLIMFFLFSLWAGFTLVTKCHSLRESEFVIASLYLVRWLIYLTGALISFNLIYQNQKARNLLFTIITISGVFVVTAGLIQLFLFPDLALLNESLGWDPHKNRLVSTFFDPNFTGAYLVLIFTLQLYKYTKYSIEVGIGKRKHFLLLFYLLLGIFLTYSRSAWGMLGIVILLFGFRNSKRLIWFSLIIGLMVYLAVPRIQTRLAGITDPADSASLRLISWKNSWLIARDNLLLGVGFNAFRTAQIEYGFLTPDTIDKHHAAGSDSSLLLVMATTGIVGFIIFILAFFLPIVKHRSFFLMTVTCALILESQFINSLFYPQIMYLWMTYFVWEEAEFLG